MVRIGIISGSTTGNTESAARKTHQALGDGAEAPRNISGVSAEELAAYDALVLGVSTWCAGDLQDDWEDALSKFDSVRLSRKKVAVFGLGDQEGYPDTFVDAIGTVAQKILLCGAQLVGMVSTDGYEFEASTAVVDGKFVGLPLDDPAYEVDRGVRPLALYPVASLIGEAGGGGTSTCSLFLGLGAIAVVIRGIPDLAICCVTFKKVEE